MKQSLSFHLAALFASVVVTAVLFESVAGLGRPVVEGSAQVALVSASAWLR